MSSSQSFVVTPGVTVTVRIQSPQAIDMMIVSNGSQYDLQWSGFGTQGVMDIPAGQQIKLEASVYNAGVVFVLPVDTLNVGGQGSVNVTSYALGEPQPKGTWPVTIPAQRVIAATTGGAVIADHLINQGNAASASPIIQVTQAGATGDEINADNQGNFYIQQYVSSILTTLFRTIAGQPAGSANVLIGDSSHYEQMNGLIEGLQGATFSGIATGQPAVVQGYSVSNQPIFQGIMNNASTQGFFSYSSNDALTGQVGHYSGGNSTTVNVIGFQAYGNHLVAFDAEVNPGQVVLKWPYGDIKASTTEQMIESVNNTSLDFNAPTGQWLKNKINNADIWDINSAGPHLMAGTIALLAGSLSRIWIGTNFTVLNGASQTFSHGLGVAPDFIFPVVTSTTNAVINIYADLGGGVNPVNQFRMSTNNAGSVSGVNVLMIKQ